MDTNKTSYVELGEAIFFYKQVRNVEYSILPVMSELSTVRCDRALGLWLQVHGRRVSTESCRGGAVADGPCLLFSCCQLCDVG